MKKILFVRDYLIPGGGGCTMSLWLVEVLSKKYDVHLVLWYEDQVDKSIVENFKVHYINKSTIRNRFIRLLALYTKNLLSFNRFIKREKPDYVVSFGTTSLTIATLLKLFNPYKLIISERRDPGSNRTLSDLIRYKCYEFSDIMVFQTEGAKKYFNKIPGSKSQIIPNPVQPQTSFWSDSDNNLSIVNVARMEVVQKRQDLIMQAFQNVLKRYPTATLHFCGDGVDLNDMKNLSEQLGINKSVVFHGRVNNVYTELIKHSVFVLASDYEGMPNALLEAMSIGMPVISTDCKPGGAAELIDNMVNGLLVPCNDVISLSDAMLKLFDDRELRHNMSKSAIKKTSNYLPSKIEKLWYNIFEI